MAAGPTETDPVKIEHAVGALFDKRDWTMLSHRVIFHGRRVCHARKPACGACTLARALPVVRHRPDRARPRPPSCSRALGPRDLAVAAGVDPELVPAQAIAAEVP